MNFLKLFGLDIKFFIIAVWSIPNYLSKYKYLKKHKSDQSHNFPVQKFYPCFKDKHEKSGLAKGHYFHQDLLIAQKIFFNSPDKHLDIGSRVDGFVGHVASFRSIDVVDIRKLDNKVKNINFLQHDITKPFPKNMHGKYNSVSCLHVIEHIGLGRYGDDLDYYGHLMGLKNISDMIPIDGLFYFSTPIGPQRIEFDAHRVFSIKYLLDHFQNNFTLVSFSYVDDKGDLHENINLTEDMIKNSCHCNYGCGIFEFRKIS